jgi:hypothetical protein
MDIHWSGSYFGLSGTPTADHFHGAAWLRQEAAPAIPMSSGADAKSPFQGTTTLTNAQAADLRGEPKHPHLADEP